MAAAAVEPFRSKPILVDKRHKENIFSSINTFRQQGAFTDVLVIVEEAKFHAHRLILAGSSPVLQAMLTADMKEKNEGTIYLSESNISAVTLEHILSYMYSGKIEIAIDNVEDILYASTYLMMQSLSQFCADFLADVLCITNCLGIREIASKYGCRDLFLKTEKLLHQEFISISNSEEFLLTSEGHLLEILSKDQLEIHSEDDMLNAIDKWIDHDPPERLDSFERLLSEVRIQFLSDEMLESLEEKCYRIYASNDVLMLFKNAWEAKMSKKHDGEFMQVGKHIRPRNCLNKRKLILSCGGYDGTRCMQTCFGFMPDEQEIYNLKVMKVARQDHATALLDDRLYVVGGFNSHKGPLESAESYNPIRNEWATIAAMNTKRKAPGVAVLNGKLYATGGLDGNYASLNTTEFYDPKCNAWQFTNSLNEARYSHCLLSNEKNLYAVGGWKLASVEKFDPGQESWELLSEMSCPRAGATAELVNDKIYVIGGRGDNGCLNTMEAYDLNTDQWATTSDASVARWRASSCVMDEQIYIIGGRDSNWQYLDCIEHFDVDEGEWHIDGKLYSKLMGLSCSEIELPMHHLK